MSWLRLSRKSLCALLSLAALQASAAPANDNYTNRTILAGYPVTVPGSNEGATREPGDPTTVGGGICNATVWYEWSAPANGTCGAAVIGPEFSHPLVDVFEITESGQLAFVTFGDGRDAYYLHRGPVTLRASQIIFNAVMGKRYAFVVGMEHPEQGAFELVVTRPPSIEAVTPATGADFPPGTDINFGVNASDPDGFVAEVQCFVPFGGWSANAVSTPWTVTWAGPPVGRYDVTTRVIDDLGAAASRTVQVTSGRPPNDDFADRILLQGLPVTTHGPLLAAGKEPGEDLTMGGVVTRKTVWWSWTAPADGLYAMVASATNLVRLAVYTGESVSGLLLQGTGAEWHVGPINSKQWFWRQALWNATAGTTYQLCVDGADAGPYDVTVSVTRPPNVELASPADGSVWAGSEPISVTATASDPDGAVREVDFFEVHTMPTYGYSVAVGSVFAEPWSLSWANGSTGNYPLAVRAVDDLGAFTTRSNRVWVGVSRPPNDDFVGRTVVPNLQGSVSVEGSNVGATAEPGEYNARSSVWWSWTAPASGPVTIDTCGSFEGAYLRVFTGDSMSNLTFYGAAAGGACASLPFEAVGGSTYHIAVEGGWTQGHVQLNITAPAAEALQLSNAWMDAGVFHVTANGRPGQRVLFETSTNLVNWSQSATNVVVGTAVEFSDMQTGGCSQRFYRARAE